MLPLWASIIVAIVVAVILIAIRMGKRG